MQQEKATHHVATLCRVLDVSASGYYAWCDRPPSARAQADEILLAQICAIHERSRGIYGAPRIHVELRTQGVRCGRKRVARLMRQASLTGAQRRRYRGTTRQDPDAVAAPDLVQRDFTASGPDQLWVADMTYVPTGEGWLYLATVLDAWSRRVVGWAMGDTLRTELVVEALNMAVWNRRPVAEVVHHSDRGAQYTSLAFSRRCREAGVAPSMGSVGDAYDNALAEAFFATLETELLMRAHVRDTGGGAAGALRFHRRVLQLASAALGARLSLPRRGRATMVAAARCRSRSRFDRDGQRSRGLELLRIDFLRPARHPDTPRETTTPAGAAGGEKNRNYKEGGESR